MLLAREDVVDDEDLDGALVLAPIRTLAGLLVVVVDNDAAVTDDDDADADTDDAGSVGV